MNYNLSLGHALVFLLGRTGCRHHPAHFPQPGADANQPRPLRSGFRRWHGAVRAGLENHRSDARTSLRVFIGDGDPSRSTSAAQASTDRPAPRAAAARMAAGAAHHHRDHLASGAGACLELCRPGPQLPGLSRARRQGAAVAVEQRHRARECPARVAVRTTSPACATTRPADSPRHIAWKSVARQHDGPLLTKLFSGATAQQVWLDWEPCPRPWVRISACPSLRAGCWMPRPPAMPGACAFPALRLAPDNGAGHLSAGLRALALCTHGTR
jgi:hypothetical protein